ncbi:MAG: DUF58 domain-containing protein, partial [Clostridia bacterium]|nr:DUF58 domain-containing protein [Clostridia bacterium]
ADGAVGEAPAAGDITKESWFLVLKIAIPVVAIIGIIYLIYFIFRDKLIGNLSYTRFFSEKGSYEGDEVTMTEVIHNKSFLPLFMIKIEYYIYNDLQYDDYPPDREHAMQYTLSKFFIILPFMQVRRKHTIKLLKRGYYTLDTINLLYAKRERNVLAPAEIYVYPKMIGIDDLPIPSSSMQGDAFSRQWLIRDPFSVSGVREYRFGDPFNTINFKATAKSAMLGVNGLRVNNRDFCSNRNFMIYLNFQTDKEVAMPFTVYEKLMEKGLSYAAALLREAFNFGYRAGFAANCTLVSGENQVKFPMTQGALNYEDILMQMSKVRLAEGVSFTALLGSDALGGLCDSEVFILTTYINEQIDRTVDTFHKFGNNVSVIMLGDLQD